MKNIIQLYNQSVEESMVFRQGLEMILRAFNFGYIADCFGDAPNKAAMDAEQGRQKDMFPVFDPQEDIYLGILEEIQTADTLLSKPEVDYSGIVPYAYVIYNGGQQVWRKMANSLILRYYMRISSKLPDVARAVIEEIISEPGTYPIFASNADDAMGYIGSSGDDSWPATSTSPKTL